MEKIQTSGVSVPPGIVIQHPPTPEQRPSISAFIWGFKVTPTPTLPYGRDEA